MATGAGIPWAVSPALIVWGRAEARPAIISEKNRPMDNSTPLFMNVARMPEAEPRSRAGTAFMIPVVLGAANSPKPMPLKNRSAPKAG